MNAHVIPASDRIVTLSDNQPPEPTPFDIARNSVEALFEEAKHWLDGATVATQAEADAIGMLLDTARKAEKLTDDNRKVEKKPHDDAAKAVQERYRPLAERVGLIAKTCKEALTPWLAAQEAEKRAEADRARKEAEDKAAAAQAAVRAASGLETKAEAERLLRDAKKADRVASKAEGDRANVKGGTRAVSLRTTYRAEITDLREYARALWAEQHPEFVAFLHGLAQRQVNAGRRYMPGVTVHEVKGAV